MLRSKLGNGRDSAHKPTLLGIGLAVLLGCVAVELTSLALHPWLVGARFSSETFRSRRTAAQAGFDLRSEQRDQPDFVKEDALHPYLGFTGDPTIDPGFSNLGFWGSLAYPPPRRRPDRLLVGIVGGSFAAGVYTEAANVIAARLATAPRFSGRSVQIVNMAHGGWKEPQQLLALNWLLALGGELDVLIDIDGFNEVALDGAENAQRGVFPAFPRGWAMRVDGLFDPDQLSRLGELVRRREDRARAAAWFDHVPLRWSPTASLVWSAIDRILSRRLYEAQRSFETARSALTRFRQVGPAVPMDPAARMTTLVEVWRRSSVELARLAAANGIEYVQFLQPNQYDDGAKPMGAAERKLAFNPQHPYRRGAQTGYPLLRAAGRTLHDEGDFFFDLSMIFRGTTEPLFADDCCHLSTEGYRRFAVAVVDAFLVRDARVRQ